MTDKALKIRAGAIALVFCLLGILISVQERMEDTAREGYLLREDYDGSAYQEELEAAVDGRKENVSVRVEPMSYSESEAEAFLDEAEAALPEMLFGNKAGDRLTGEPIRVDSDLNLPTVLEGLPVTADYLTDQSQILSYDGEIGPQAAADGSSVRLEVILRCGSCVRTVSYELLVFPARGQESSFQKKVDEAALELNRPEVTQGNATGSPKQANKPEEANKPDPDKWYLPTEIDGQTVAWRTSGGDSGVTVGALGLVIAVVYLFAAKQRKEDAERRKKESMMRDYPHVVSKLVLLLGAGLSMRRAFKVMTDDYRKAFEATGKKRWGFEAAGGVCADLEAGLNETEAYYRLGQRCDLPAYRTFSVLLTQNLRRGSRELMAMLESEAVSAFEERKKDARIQGERASAKLLMPMMLMLLVVFVIVMVPAFLSF